MEIVKEQGRVSWQSPSNIALVKYWGKYGRQLPKSPSISFTLSSAYTNTVIDYQFRRKAKEQIKVDFLFEGKENEAFKVKIEKYLSSISDELEILSHLDLKIGSENSFPHSSGIASSASSMSALALCLLAIDKEVKGYEKIDFKQASHLARLGSGSASRSVYGPLTIWGETALTMDSSNRHAIPFTEGIDPVFNSFHDDILIISKKEKAVSSRAGHALMENNPYAASRFEQAHTHLREIVSAMQTGDLEIFGEIVEKEALTLHALMMASSPPYMLMEPNTLAAINRIWSFRNETKIPVYFTLDAGPNIHLLYPDNYSEKVESLLQELLTFCEEGIIIKDQVGLGPKQML